MKLLKIFIALVVLAGVGYCSYRVVRHYVLVKNLSTQHLKFTMKADPQYAPVYGKIKLGAYAGEAADIAGIVGSSTLHLYQYDVYEKYRKMVREVYGLDLEDMNYVSVGPEKWVGKIERIKQWILMAGTFGDVTIALEPTGKMHYGVFEDSDGMRKLRDMFAEVGKKGITVWIRFASEANLAGSPYSASKTDQKAIEFYQKAQWFKSYMPSNVKVVFSPLINTALLPSERQARSIRLMFLGGETAQGKLPWDRIGGTIYRKDIQLISSYDRYYKMMSAMAPDLPFQICEVGGHYANRDEVLQFLKLLSEGHWPKVQKVNLFARDINKRADPSGSFGYIEPMARAKATEEARSTGKPVVVESWIKPIIGKKK